MTSDDYQAGQAVTTGVTALPHVRIIDLDRQRRVFVPSHGLAWKVTHLVAHDYWHIERADRGVIDPKDEQGRLIVAACKDFFAQLRADRAIASATMRLTIWDEFCS